MGYGAEGEAAEKVGRFAVIFSHDFTTLMTLIFENFCTIYCMGGVYGLIHGTGLYLSRFYFPLFHRASGGRVGFRG